MGLHDARSSNAETPNDHCGAHAVKTKRWAMIHLEQVVMPALLVG